MNWLIYILVGFAIGVEVGRLQAGRKFQWKKALIALLIAAVAAGIIAWLIR